MSEEKNGANNEEEAKEEESKEEGRGDVDTTWGTTSLPGS